MPGPRGRPDPPLSFRCRNLRIKLEIHPLRCCTSIIARTRHANASESAAQANEAT